MPPEHEVTGSNPVGRAVSEPGSDRFPRGAIAVVLIGLLATALVAWISDEDLISSKPLPWLESHEDVIEPDGPVAFGDGGSLMLTSSGIDVTGTNSAGYRLFQVGGEVSFDPGPDRREQATITCRADTQPPTVNARTPRRPAGFPGPIENLDDAPWPGDVIIDYSDQGSPYSTVTLPTAYMGYGGTPGIEVNWGDWEAGSQTWIWTLPAERADPKARLRFVSLWRTYDVPEVELKCRAEIEAGGPRARVSTGGRLPD